jgi:effector-binding domain-containing protein
MAVFDLVTLEPSPAAVVRATMAVSDFPSFFGHAFGAVAAAVAGQGLEIVGEPFAFVPSSPADVVEVAAGFPVSAAAERAGDVVPLELPGGRGVTTVHVGPYDTMAKTYEQMRDWISVQSLSPGTHLWEVYLSDPAAEPDPSTWRTRIVWPVSD